MTRVTYISDLPMSDAVKKLNPGLLGGIITPAKPVQAVRGGRGVNNFAEIAANKPRLRQDRKGPNKLEQEFEAWLREEYRSLDGVRIRREGIHFQIGNGSKFIADFTVTIPRSHLPPRTGVYYELLVFETKGFMREDAAVKIKAAAHLFPEFKFHLVTKRKKRDGGGWAIEDVLP